MLHLAVADLLMAVYLNFALRIQYLEDELINMYDPKVVRSLKSRLASCSQRILSFRDIELLKLALPHPGFCEESDLCLLRLIAPTNSETSHYVTR